MKMPIKLTLYVSKSLHLSDFEIILLKHGISILFYDGIEIAAVLVISLFINQTFLSFLYITLFSFLRIYSGGIHSKTKFGCFIVYLVLYLLMLLFTYFYNYCVLMSFLAIAIAGTYVWNKAPIQSHLQPLSNFEFNINRKKCHIVLVVIFILFIYSISFLKSFSNMFVFIICADAISVYLLRNEERMYKNEASSIDR